MLSGHNRCIISIQQWLWAGWFCIEFVGKKLNTRAYDSTAGKLNAWWYLSLPGKHRRKVKHARGIDTHEPAHTTGAHEHLGILLMNSSHNVTLQTLKNLLFLFGHADVSVSSDAFFSHVYVPFQCIYLIRWTEDPGGRRSSGWLNPSWLAHIRAPASSGRRPDDPLCTEWSSLPCVSSHS